jgi:hypothetical protein
MKVVAVNKPLLGSPHKINPGHWLCILSARGKDGLSAACDGQAAVAASAG